MEWSMSLSHTEREVVTSLIPMFPHMDKEVIKQSVLHPSNRGEPFNNYTLLNRCIDDLLELRTFKGVDVVDLTQDVTLDIPEDDFWENDIPENDKQRFDTPSPTIRDQIDTSSSNDQRQINSPNLEDERQVTTPSPSVHRQSATPSPITNQEINTPSPSDQVQSATSSPIDWQHLNMPSPNDKRECDTPSPNDKRQRDTPSPDDQLQLSTPSPGDQLQLSTPSPDDQRQLSTPSPSMLGPIYSPSLTDQRQLDTPSPIDWGTFAAPSPKDRRELATPSPNDQRQLDTPSPSKWRAIDSPSPNDQKQFGTSEKRHLATPSPNIQLQLPTPSPMSTSDDDFERNDPSPISTTSSSSIGNQATSMDTTSSVAIPGAVSAGDGSMNNGMKADDSGFDSATVSPVIDLTATPRKNTSNVVTLNSNPWSAKKAIYEVPGYKRTQVIDLTSPESVSSQWTLKNAITEERNSPSVSSTLFSDSKLSTKQNSAFIKEPSFVFSSKNTTPAPLNLPTSTGTTTCQVVNSLFNVSSSKITSPVASDSGIFSTAARSKSSAPSTASCTCDDCLNKTGSSDSKPCHSRSAVRHSSSEATSTTTRPPPSPASLLLGNAKFGVTPKSPMTTNDTSTSLEGSIGSSFSGISNKVNRDVTKVTPFPDLGNSTSLKTNVSSGIFHANLASTSTNVSKTISSNKTSTLNPKASAFKPVKIGTVPTLPSAHGIVTLSGSHKNTSSINGPKPALHTHGKPSVISHSAFKQKNSQHTSKSMSTSSSETKHKQESNIKLSQDRGANSAQGTLSGVKTKSNHSASKSNEQKAAKTDQQLQVNLFDSKDKNENSLLNRNGLLGPAFGENNYQLVTGPRQKPNPPPTIPRAEKPNQKSKAEIVADLVAFLRDDEPPRHPPMPPFMGLPPHQPPRMPPPPLPHRGRWGPHHEENPFQPGHQHPMAFGPNPMRQEQHHVPHNPHRPKPRQPQVANRNLPRPEPNLRRPEPNLRRPEPNLRRPEPNLPRPEPNLPRPEPNLPRPEPNLPRPEPNRPNHRVPNQPQPPGMEAQDQPVAQIPNALDNPQGLNNPQRPDIQQAHLQGPAFNFPGGNEVPEELILNITSEVLALFGEADKAWVRNKVLAYIAHGDVVTAVCNDMLENGYPKMEDKAAKPEPKKTEEKKVNYFTEYERRDLHVDMLTERQCHKLLQNEFRRLSCYTIGAAMALFNHHYAPTKKCLEELVNNNQEVRKAYNLPKTSPYDDRRVYVNIAVKENGKDVEKRLKIEVNKCMRAKSFITIKYEPSLQKEIEFFNAQLKCDAEERDRQVALQLNEDQYEQEGQLIECGCCYGEVTFDDMVQCSDGHLFCQSCLQRYAQEATYGEGKAQIVCMTDGCNSIFPRSQLQKALTANDLAKYDDRVGEESLQLADMGDNLVRCPYCNYAALMEAGDKVFQCQASDCKKETCRYCKEDWKGHFGIPCDEIEKKSDTKVRVSYEERMTMAKIRTCHRCKAGFTKSEGCNKMTCRCGSKMCYICRKPNIDYNHFCRHPRDPGHSCTQCNDCSLWSNPEEDDERAVQEIRKQMEDEKKEREKRSASSETDEPNAKKPRME